MSLFQNSVVQKYLSNLNTEKLKSSFEQFKKFYGDQERINNIRQLKEENYQEGFLREIFCDVLGFTINPNKNYNLTTEYKNETDSKKADGAILLDGKAIGVIELKSTKTINLESITDQAFNYKNHQSSCRYIITSNFEKLRFYIDNATDYEEFDLFNLDFTSFTKLYLFISKENIYSGIPSKLKEESKIHEETISDKLYKDYRDLKNKIFNNLVANNPQVDKILLFQKSQKLLDRILFILFAEDSGLVPPNAITKIVDQWKHLKELDEPVSLYSRFIKFFHHMDVGHKYKDYEIPPYNGGLFQNDEVLDKAIIDDEVLEIGTLKLSTYDFSSEVDVNILGHIFEHSLSEIEEVAAQLEGKETDKSKSRRKKEGVYYTPKYITKYIVDNTVGALAREKKEQLGLFNIVPEIFENPRIKKGTLNKEAKVVFDNLQKYKDYLLTLKILDPACGSGAFLNQALDFLIKEHTWIAEQTSALLGEVLVLPDVGKDILEKNLYGVDINEEAVEIAKLSLWLRTAQKGRKLSDLSSHIKCGNSLIDDPAVAGDKAFDWKKEFEEVMKDGGFDVVIGNPPYTYRLAISENEKNYYEENYDSYQGNYELYKFFVERGIDLLNINGLMSFITSATYLVQPSFVQLRKKILNETHVLTLAPLGPSVFASATVDTAIIVIKKEKKTNSLINILTPTQPEQLVTLLPYQIAQSRFESNEKQTFDYLISDSFYQITKKIYSNSKPLDNYFEVGVGINTGYIKNELVSDNKIDERFHPMVSGDGISRYGACVTNGWIMYDKEFVKMKGKLGRTLPAERFFNSPKILVVRTRNISLEKRIIATLDLNQNYNLNRLSNIIAKDNSDLYTLLGILNSNLFNWLFSKKYFDYEIKPVYIKECPIAIDANSELSHFVKSLLNNHSTIFELANKLILLLKSNCSLLTVSGKLQAYYNHDFAIFLTELKKQKINLTLKQQEEWEPYFTETKTKINKLQTQIAQTDKEIDQMVYRLYGLTEEEIKIVEGD